MSGLLGVPVDAAYHLVFALTRLLAPLAGGLAAAVAIVLFTAAVRLLVAPLSFRALRGQAALARLAPQVQALRARHAGRPERLSRELTALYQREGASPFAGILPLLAQWPFLSVMYLLFRSGTVGGAPNQLLSDGLFGVPLGAHWLSGAGLLGVHDALFLAALAVLAVLCWLSARLTRQAAPSAPVSAPAPTATRRPAVPARVGQSRGGQSRGGQSRGGRRPGARTAANVAEAPAGGRAAELIARVTPYVSVVIAAFAPLAAVIYLLVTVAWTFGERRLFVRRGARAAAAPATARTARAASAGADAVTRAQREG